MRLYLVQHGEAVPKDLDPARPLSETGERTVDAVAAFLAKRALGVSEIWHSGKLRAGQTAERLAPHIAPGGLVRKKAGLAPKDNVAPLAEKISRRTDDLMIVGHLPHLGQLAGYLLTGDSENRLIAFAKAGVVCLLRAPDGTWAVAWMITPEMLEEPA